MNKLFLNPTESGESDVEDVQDCLYFAGNSLGLQPKCANDLVQARDRDKREESIYNSSIPACKSSFEV